MNNTEFRNTRLWQLRPEDINRGLERYKQLTTGFTAWERGVCVTLGMFAWGCGLRARELITASQRDLIEWASTPVERVTPAQWIRCSKKVLRVLKHMPVEAEIFSREMMMVKAGEENA